MVIAIDEAQYLLNDASSLSFLGTAVRHSRHYDLSVQFITQMGGEFALTPEARTIANLCSMTLIHRVDEAAEKLADWFGLSERQTDWVRSATAGNDQDRLSEALLHIDDASCLNPYLGRNRFRSPASGERMTFDRRPWDDPFTVEEAYDGIERRVLAFTDDLMLVHYTVEEEAVFPEHEHETAHQAVFVLEGELELFGARSATLAAGDSFVIGPGIRHGVRGTASVTRLVDAFTPAVDAYGSA